MLINSTNKIKLNIIFQSSDKLALYNYKIKVENTLKRSKYLYKITYFPTKTKRYSILRSPHIYKYSDKTPHPDIHASDSGNPFRCSSPPDRWFYPHRSWHSKKYLGNPLPVLQTDPLPETHPIHTTRYAQ